MLSDQETSVWHVPPEYISENPLENGIPLLLQMMTDLSRRLDSMDMKLDQLVSEIHKKDAEGGFNGGRNGEKLVKKNHSSESSTPDYSPSMTFENWLESVNINKTHVNMIFRSTILDGFKQVLQQIIHDSQPMVLPIVTIGAKHKSLLVYQEREEVGKWYVLDGPLLNYLVESIWRKMLEFYFTSEAEPGEDETVRDFHKKKLVDMRKVLTDKHMKEIERFICKILL
jgi:hypothetical protein